MKLTPLGKRLDICCTIAVCSGFAALISFILGFACSTVIFLSVCVGACVIIWNIGIDANFEQYGLWGRRCGADSLHVYEPGDPEYEREKHWQNSDEDIEIHINIDVRTVEDRKKDDMVDKAEHR